ncbi:5843_t:CDS:2 [Entrophospora sp. SA101]|nr:5843_t:CDS:2 [Entrophospora sp. SA101]
MSDINVDDNDYLKNVKIGVIGGTGLYHCHHLELIKEIYPKTPWGYPSSNITIFKDSSGFKIAFLARHGEGHKYNPTQVPSRANIAALKHIGVEIIIAFSAVGSLRKEIKPRDFILPSQIIDRTKGIRPFTYFEDGITCHVTFADPFNQQLADIIYRHKNIIEGTNINDEDDKLVFHRDKTIICMEGPAFSTKAESKLYRSWGCDVINMSVLPEAKLAKELEIAYQMICMSTDYDSWNHEEGGRDLETALKENKFHDIKDTTKNSCITRQEARNKEMIEKLNYRALAAADRVKYLNPRVNVTTDTDDIRNKPKDYFQKFDLITLTDCDTNTIIEINRICHELGKKFYAASTYGIYGYIFCDLLQHEFIEERRVAIPHKDEVEIKMIKKNAKYENFETFLSNDWATTKRKKIKPLFWAIQIILKFQQANNHPPKLSEDIEKLSSIRDSYMQSVGIDSSFVSDELLKSLVLNFSAELSPICAIVGGILAQDILKALSCKELPINNFFIYDGNEGSGLIYKFEKSSN